MGEIGSSVPGRVKPMTYKIASCRFLARQSILVGHGKDWLAQCQDTVTGWDIRLWDQLPDFPVGKDYKMTMSAHCHKLVSILI